MPDAYAVTSVAFPTTGEGGTLDVTISGLGWTPTFVRVVVCLSGADGTVVANDGSLSIGYADGTNERCAAVFTEDAGSDWDSYRRMASNQVAMLLDGNGNIDGELGFNSFISDGVRFDVDNQASLTARLICHFFRATATLVGNGNVASGGGTHVATHSFGTTTNVFGMAMTTGGAINDTSSSHAGLSEGFFVGTATGPTGDQCSWGCYHNDGTSDGTISGDDDRAVMVMRNGSVSRAAEVTAWGTTSATFTQRAHTDDFGFDLCYAFLQMPNGVDFGVNTFAASATPHTETTAFEPEGVMLNGINNDQTDFVNASSSPYTAGVACGGTDGTRHESAAWYGDDSGAGDAGALWQTDPLATVNCGTDAKGSVLEFASFNATDFRLNEVTGVAGMMIWLAFETPAAGPADVLQDPIQAGMAIPFAR